MRWNRLFILICTALLAATAAVLIAIVYFGKLGIGIHGAIALVLGALMTMGMAMGLMGLMFLSNRSGHDEDAHSGSGDSNPDRGPSTGNLEGRRRPSRE